jgi:hypothetical protein
MSLGEVMTQNTFNSGEALQLKDYMIKAAGQI